MLSPDPLAQRGGVLNFAPIRPLSVRAPLGLHQNPGYAYASAQQQIF